MPYYYENIYPRFETFFYKGIPCKIYYLGVQYTGKFCPVCNHELQTTACTKITTEKKYQHKVDTEKLKKGINAALAQNNAICFNCIGIELGLI